MVTRGGSTGREILRAAVAPDRWGFLQAAELEVLASDPATAAELILFRCGGFRALVPACSAPAFVAAVYGARDQVCAVEAGQGAMLTAPRLAWVECARFRALVPVEQVAGFRRAVEGGGDYVRDASLPADTCDRLRAEFSGVPS